MDDLSEVEVRKLDHTGQRIERSWKGRLVEAANGRIVVRAPFAAPSGREVTIDGVQLRSGDQFTEFYYEDRWYNVMHIADADGVRKGWYCNITRPATFADGIVSYADLALDLFVHPDGRQTVLDE